MVVNSFSISGRLQLSDIKEGVSFYECWAGDTHHYVAIEDPYEEKDGVFKFVAQSLEYPEIRPKNRPTKVFVFDEKNRIRYYLYDYPAYVPIDKHDSRMIF